MTDCSVDGCARPSLKKSLCGSHYMRLRRHGDVTGGRTAVGEPEKFLEAALLARTGDCIVWPFGTTSTGYAGINTFRGFRRVSHIVLERCVGPAPSDEHIAAHAPQVCHNPLCINYRHLRWATRAENEADKLLDGTDARGEKHGQSKLTESVVQSIRLDGRPVAQIAWEHGVHVETIRKIKRGARWGWL